MKPEISTFDRCSFRGMVILVCYFIRNRGSIGDSIWYYSLYVQGGSHFTKNQRKYDWFHQHSAANIGDDLFYEKLYQAEACC